MLFRPADMSRLTNVSGFGRSRPKARLRFLNLESIPLLCFIAFHRIHTGFEILHFGSDLRAYPIIRSLFAHTGAVVAVETHSDMHFEDTE